MMKFQGPEPKLSGHDGKQLQMLQKENKRLASSLQVWPCAHVNLHTSTSDRRR